MSIPFPRGRAAPPGTPQGARVCSASPGEGAASGAWLPPPLCCGVLGLSPSFSACSSWPLGCVHVHVHVHVCVCVCVCVYVCMCVCVRAMR